MYEDLRGKTALVTGSGQGIGKGIALALAKAGVDVAVNVRKSVENGEETSAEARNEGVKSLVYQADIGDRKAVFSMVDRVLSDFGKIDILINNAGTGVPRGISFEDLSEDAYREVMDGGINGVAELLQFSQ